MHIKFSECLDQNWSRYCHKWGYLGSYWPYCPSQVVIDKTIVSKEGKHTAKTGNMYTQSMCGVMLITSMTPPLALCQTNTTSRFAVCNQNWSRWQSGRVIPTIWCSCTFMDHDPFHPSRPLITLPNISEKTLSLFDHHLKLWRVCAQLNCRWARSCHPIFGIWHSRSRTKLARRIGGR